MKLLSMKPFPFNADKSKPTWSSFFGVNENVDFIYNLAFVKCVVILLYVDNISEPVARS